MSFLTSIADADNVEGIPQYEDLLDFRYMGIQRGDIYFETSHGATQPGDHYYLPKIRLTMPGSYRLRFYVYNTNGSVFGSSLPVKGNVQINEDEKHSFENVLQNWVVATIKTFNPDYFAGAEPARAFSADSHNEEIGPLIAFPGHTVMQMTPEKSEETTTDHYPAFFDYDFHVDKEGVYAFEISGQPISDLIVRYWYDDYYYLPSENSNSTPILISKEETRPESSTANYDNPVPLFAVRLLIHESIMNECKTIGDTIRDNKKGVQISNRVVQLLGNNLVIKRILASQISRSTQALDLVIEGLTKLANDLQGNQKIKVTMLINTLQGIHLLKSDEDLAKNWTLEKIAKDPKAFKAYLEKSDFTSTVKEYLTFVADALTTNNQEVVTEEAKQLLDELGQYLAELETKILTNQLRLNALVDYFVMTGSYYWRLCQNAATRENFDLQKELEQRRQRTSVRIDFSLDPRSEKAKRLIIKR